VDFLHSRSYGNKPQGTILPNERVYMLHLIVYLVLHHKTKYKQSKNREQMKRIFMYFAIFAIAQVCAQEPLPTEEKLTINTSKSEIKWSCDYSFYFNGHYGFVNFEEGHFIKTDDKITGGSFVIDLNTIRATDMDEEGNEGLTKHLKDPDFFEVERFPKAALVIYNVTYEDATHFWADANMTIKGVTQPVRFKATLDFTAQTMTTKFKIDRTRWGITYNNAIKDSAISDAVGFEVKISL
jgi:polyisoprenoid-binding protein YceI